MIKLANVEERNAESNGKFWIPPLHERQSLEPGDYAKVIFATEPGERMWVKVSALLGGMRYLGVLSNAPVVTSEFMMGDKVEFGAENVCEILRREQ
jgi:hypothetical protein